MEEVGKVRVVRCPKCQKLLPELPDIPVYRCGGCDATLQSKNEISARKDAPLGKSDEGKLKIFDSFVNEAAVINRACEGVEIVGKDRILAGVTVSLSGSVLGRGNGDVLDDYHERRDFEESDHEQGRYRHPSKAPVENSVVSANWGPHVDEFLKAGVKEIGETKALSIESTNGFAKLSQMTEREELGRDEQLVFRRVRRADNSRHCPYSDEGPSTNHDLDESDRVETFEKDREELLRKLDELRNQLSRSCDVSDYPKERNLANRRMVPPYSFDGRESWFAEGHGRGSGVSSQFFQPDNPIRMPSYFDGERHGPLMGTPDLEMENCYPSLHCQNEFMGYREPFGPQIPRRPLHEQHSQFPQRPSNGYLSGQYLETDLDSVAPYPPCGFYEQPPCSCMHCHNRNWPLLVYAHPAFGNHQLPGITTNRMLYHLDNPGSYGLGPLNYRGARAPPQACAPQPYIGKPSDLEFEMGGFRRSQPHRSMLAKGNWRSCLPIADGAPFIICSNCFELLQLPQKLLLVSRNECKTTERNQYKLRCGSCSNLISFTFDGKRLVFPFASQTKDLMLQDGNVSSGAIKDGLDLSKYKEKGTMSTYSDGYESLNYDIPATDTKPASPPYHLNGDDLIGKESKLNLSESEKRQGLTSSSVSFEDEEYPDSMIAQGAVSNSAEHPLGLDRSSPIAGSPPNECVDYSPTNQVVDKFGKGNRSKRSDHEKLLLLKGAARQNSVKDASVATEMDCSYNEYTTSGVSQDSAEAGKADDWHKASRGGESFLAGFIKKSFKDFGRFNQSSQCDHATVLVNGHPIPDRIVKKAERKAGQIHPGEYWYDYRAGFWGVIGHQCIGIIPPSIEEFNYPLPRNCSGGDTGVFVNSRELHQKDLDLLASRGLPTTRDKSYVVEISGRVSDEASGEELDGLGKLAPTVEKVGHGFGMRVPRSMA